MDEQNRYSDDEKVIDVADLIAELLRRWRSILVVSLIAALIGGVSAVIKKNTVVSSESEETASIEEALTQEQIYKVDELYRDYLVALRSSDLEDDYYQKSILYNLNPSEIIEYQIEYSYTSSNQDIVSSYQYSLLDTDDYKKIAEIMGKPDSYLYAGELISISDVGSTDNSNIEYMTEQLPEDTYQGLFFIDIRATSEEEIQGIADIVTNAVEKHTEDLKETGITVTISKINEQYITDDQTSQITVPTYNGQNNQSVYASVEALSEDERAYFDSLVKGEKESQDTNEQEATENASGESDISIVKYAVIGLVIGWLIMIVVYALAYIMSDTIKVPDDLSRISGKRVLGVLGVPRKYHGLNGIIQSAADRLSSHGEVYDTDDQLSKLSSRIFRLINHQHPCTIFFIVDNSSKDNQVLIQQFKIFLMNEDISVQLCDPSTDINVLNQISKNDYCILIGKLKVSKCTRLQSNQVLCSETGADLLGTVSLI